MKPFVLSLLSVVFIVSCEEVPPKIDFSAPYVTKDTTYVSSTVPPAQHKAVLIEDLTGVRCVNCPQAAAKIKEIIDEKTEDSVIAMALYLNQLPTFTTPHAGFPLCNSEVATTIVDFFGVPSGLPSGYIDRHIFAPNTVRSNTVITTWKGLVNQRLKESTPVNINLSADVSGKNVSIKLKFAYNSDQSTATHKYALYLIEDGIVGMQTGAPAPSDQYVHNHVLRYSFGNPTGIEFNAPLVAGRTFEKLLDYTVPDDYVLANLHLICIVSDSNTGDVLNVRSVHL